MNVAHHDIDWPLSDWPTSCKRSHGHGCRAGSLCSTLSFITATSVPNVAPLLCGQVTYISACLWQSPGSVGALGSVVLDPGAGPSGDLFRRASGPCVCVSVCVTVHRVFRLSDPPCRVFMRSQANCVIKALINVTVCVYCVCMCASGGNTRGKKNKKTTEMKRMFLCLDEQMFCCAGRTGGVTGVTYFNSLFFYPHWVVCLRVSNQCCREGGKEGWEEEKEGGRLW